MSDSHPVTEAAPVSTGTPNFKRRAILSFGLFTVFFIFYMGTAILQTPNFRETAAIPFMGMPLGLALSLAVFPLSWSLLAIYFYTWR